MLTDFCENSELSYQSFMDLIVLLADPSKIKKSRKVNFAQDIDDAKISFVRQKSEDKKPIGYWKPLNELAMIASKHVLEAAIECKHPEKFIATLHCLSKEFKSEEYFKSIQPPSVMNLYEVISKMLLEDIGEKRKIIELIFMLFEFLTQEEKMKIYEDLTKVLISFCQCLIFNLIIIRNGIKSLFSSVRLRIVLPY